jgi:hypothetical protein
MPLLQKQHAQLAAHLLPEHPEGRIIPKAFFVIDAERNLSIPAPMGAIILRSGSFKILETGDALLPHKIINTGAPGVVLVDGNVTLVDMEGNTLVPNKLLPSARSIVARERGVHKNLLLKTHGGVGDIVCAEPAVRFAVERFQDQSISLCTNYPEFFQHLKFDKIYPASGPEQPDYRKFLLFQNFTQGDELAWEFVSHPLTHAVDYASLNMWRCTLPNNLKEIKIVPTEEQRIGMRVHFPLGSLEAPIVVVHPGKTWDSRTFPKKWWNEVLIRLQNAGLMPVIIGGQVDKQADGSYRASTVDVETTGCLDLRGKLSFIETVALLQEANVLLTNDSSPLHMAASGNAWVGFCSTVKDPSHLMHWRNGEFGWRMKNFTDGNLFETLNFCPNQEQAVHVDKVNINELLKWLPTPAEFAAWAIGKCRPYDIG